MTVPKAQFSYGWDFSPRVLSCGIWDDIRLVSCRGAYIQDMWVSAAPLEERDPTPARWRLRLALHRFGAQPLSATVTVSDLDGVTLFVFTHTQLDGRAPEICFDMPRLYRWWPWDQGQPHLYRVTVQVFDRQGWADERSITTGMRSITRDTLADGKPWRFTVNNRHVFLRGANWVPIDILPGRIAPDDYRAWLRMASAAGINFLRVWGGGIREKQAFWDECDKQGILAWQEFPLACAFLDHYPRDAVYLHILRQEARGTVRLLRNHPSLLAWCGGNEINPKREAASLATLQSIVAEEDPERPWIAASPLIRTGDVHEWGVWHGGTPWPSLAERTDAFMSEFGLQALPNATTISEMFDCQPPELWRRQWEARKAQTSKLRHYGGPAMDTCLDAAISESQRVQSAAMQAGLEACRIRREPAAIKRPVQPVPCGGVVFWQLNDPWPVVSWSVIDYWRRPKLAYQMLRDAYQPVLIAARFARGAYRAAQVLAAEVWLVNDGPETHTNCTAQARLDEVLIWRQDSIAVYSGQATTVGGFEVTLARPPGFLTLELTCGVALLARNRYDLQVPVTSRPGVLPRLRRLLADRLLTG
jgi:beta-mannosidase